MPFSSQDRSIKQLFNDITKGTIQIPSFQRDFVWRKPQVLSLLDSIRLEIPLGAITLWEPEELHRDLFEPFFAKDNPKATNKRIQFTGDKDTWQIERVDHLVDPEQAKKDLTFGVIDGQQRLTSLLLAFGGITHYDAFKPFSGFFYLDLTKDINDPDESPFGFIKRDDANMKKETATKWTSPIGQWIAEGRFPLWLCPHIDSFAGALPEAKHYSGTPPGDIQKRSSRLMRFNSIISELKLTQISLTSLPFNEVCEIFERINSAGTKVSVVDIIHAQLAGKTDGSFDLRSRFRGLSDGSVGPSNNRLRHWITSQSNHKHGVNLVTATYLNHPDNVADGKRGLVTDFKATSLKNTPHDVYTALFSCTTDDDGNDHYRNLEELDNCLEQFTVATQGVWGINLCPYPVALCIFVALWHRLTHTASEKQSDNIHESLIHLFRPFFWRLSFHTRYDQGFLTKSVADETELADFLLNDKHYTAYSEDRPTWWLEVDKLLNKMDVKQPNKTEWYNAVTSNPDLHGSLQKVAKALLWRFHPSDISDAPGSAGKLFDDFVNGNVGIPIDRHHFFPKMWVQKNCSKATHLFSQWPSALIPMTSDANKKWCEDAPLKVLRDWHPNRTPDFDGFKDLFESIGINHKSAQLVFDEKQSPDKRVKEFHKSRALYLAEEAAKLCLAADLVLPHWL